LTEYFLTHPAAAAAGDVECWSRFSWSDWCKLRVTRTKWAHAVLANSNCRLCEQIPVCHKYGLPESESRLLAGEGCKRNSGHRDHILRKRLVTHTEEMN